jgi:4-amino-4-deoxy-L-arabinose transferase-like glycosyltransferase
MSRRVEIEYLKFVTDKSLVADIVAKYKGNYPVVYGVPRSGSTLLRNILNTIFDGNIQVQKHDFFKTTAKVICAYRDFRDSAVSQWRIQRAGFDTEDTKQVVDFNTIKFNATHIQNQVNNNLNRFKQHYDSSQIYFARYETYHNDFDYLCNDLEQFFEIVIVDELRNFLKQTWNKDIVKRKFSNALKAFQGMDGETEIHGQHVYKGAVGTYQELLVPEAHEEITNFFKPELETWGYI